MLIISNSLTEKVDEGCLKVTYNLIKRLKKSHGGAFVITYERKSELSDRYMEFRIDAGFYVSDSAFGYDAFIKIFGLL